MSVLPNSRQVGVSFFGALRILWFCVTVGAFGHPRGPWRSRVWNNSSYKAVTYRSSSIRWRNASSIRWPRSSKINTSELQKLHNRSAIIHRRLQSCKKQNKQTSKQKLKRNPIPGETFPTVWISELNNCWRHLTSWRLCCPAPAWGGSWWFLEASASGADVPHLS